MFHPSPAIVAQDAVRRLPRLALWLLCWAYVLPGLLGREPWKNADLAAYGYMAELAASRQPADWLAPRLLGLAPEVDGLLPYWLGAVMIRLAPAGIPPDLATRLPFIALLMLTLAATWYGVYHLARIPGAQPVAFAFGGEAHPVDYARALADGGLLALIGGLGLAQLSHEITPATLQLCCTALTFYAAAALSSGRVWAWLAGGFGLLGLTLSGAPSMAVLLGTGITGLLAVDRSDPTGRIPWRVVLGWAGLTLLAAALATGLDLWRWRLTGLPATWVQWRGWGKLLLWFTWPLWPLALWTLWSWRRQLGAWRAHRHLMLPLWFVLLALVPTLLSPLADRSLLLGLPALATLAAFALPTFSRSVRALIDWFTLLFFSGCAVVIWVIWLAMQTGWPAAPARNVAKLAPGFVPSFQLLPTMLAVLATLAWIGLVVWRTRRHRKALWKSMVLPASGAVLCWLLLTSLWLPLLDYARSYAPVMQAVTRQIGHPDCVQVQGLTRDQLAALRLYGDYRLETLAGPADARCPWLVTALHKASARPDSPETLGYAPQVWQEAARHRRPTDQHEVFVVLRRQPPRP